MSVADQKTSHPKDALDLLAEEDERLSELFDEFERTAGSPGVEERDAHGTAAKLLVRHLAIWESARDNLADALSERPEEGVAEVAARLAAGGEERRRLLDRVEQLSRGLEPMNLNLGQDFDGAMEPLRQLVRREVRWDLDDALPRLRGALTETIREEELPSARYVAKHAPTNPTPDRHRWFEKSSFLTRLRTIYDHLRDYPFVRRGAEAKRYDKPGT